MSYDDYKWKKRKYYIRINCWIIIALLVAILCFMFPIISHAEGDSVSVPSGYSSFGSVYGVNLSNIFTNDSINDLPDGAINPTTWNANNTYGLNMFDGDMSNGELLIKDSVFSEVIKGYYMDEDGVLSDMHDYYLSDFDDHYCITYDSQSGSFIYCFLDNHQYDVNFSSVGVFATHVRNYPYNNSDGLFYKVSGYFELMNGYDNCYVINSMEDYLWSMSGSDYGVFLNSDSVWSKQLMSASVSDFNNLLASNVSSLYTIIPSERNGGDALTYEITPAEIGSEIVGDPHYLISKSEVTYPDGSGGDVTNNMYMETADWKFNIPKYWHDTSDTYANSRYIANWGKGTISFSGLLNDYQIDHASDFYLQFSFYIKMNSKYSVPGIDDNGPVFRSFAGSYALRDVEKNLTNFIEHDNNFTWSVQDIFDTATNLDGFSFTSFMRDNSVYSQYKDFDWTISCTAKLVSGNYVSGSIQETYNFITQISKEDSNTITDNTNPYYPPDDNGDPTIPDKPNTSTTSDNGINITINNNPTFTNNNNNNNNFNPVNNVIPDGDGGTDENGDNLLTWIVKKLFGYIDALVGGVFDASGLNDNNDGVTQNSLITGDSLGTSNNGFLAFLNNTFTFIPQGMWNVLQYFFTVSIVILIIAFLIRIILDIL